MRTRRHPARWTSRRRARRASRRCCLVCRHGGTGPAVLPLDGDPTQARRARPVRSAAPQGCSAASAAPVFVELFRACPAEPEPDTRERCHPGGQKLPLSLRGAPGLDLVALLTGGRTQALGSAGR